MRTALSILALILLTGGTFLAVKDYGYVDYDDPAYISDNIYVNSGLDSKNLQWALTHHHAKGPTSHPGVTNLYHPLTWISHMTDVQLFGVNNPQAQHLVNLAIHILSAIIAFLFLRLLLQDHWIALFAATLFAIHPLHVESVAWLTERKDTLSGLFFFATLLTYLLYLQKKSLPLLISSIAFCTLAAFSKPSVVILPGILTLIDIYRSKKFPEINLAYLLDELRSKLPWLAPCLLVAALTFYFQSSGSHAAFSKDISFLSRMNDLPTKLTYYVYRTFNPTSLTFHYVRPPFNPILLQLISIAFWATIVAVTWLLRNKINILPFGILWFLTCMIPVSGIVYVGTSFTADRYTYLSILGFFLIIATLIKNHLPTPIWASAFALITVACTYLSFQQTKVWKDSYTLFENATKAQPRDPAGFTNLATKYQVDKHYDKADPIFKKALQLNPKDYTSLHNLGVAQLNHHKDIPKAIDYFNQANEAHAAEYPPSLRKLIEIEVRSPSPNSQNVHDLSHRYNKLTKYQHPPYLIFEIEALLHLGQKQEALPIFKKLQRLPNTSPQILQKIGQALERR